MIRFHFSFFKSSGAQERGAVFILTWSLCAPPEVEDARLIAALCSGAEPGRYPLWIHEQPKRRWRAGVSLDKIHTRVCKIEAFHRARKRSDSSVIMHKEMEDKERNVTGWCSGYRPKGCGFHSLMSTTQPTCEHP